MTALTAPASSPPARCSSCAGAFRTGASSAGSLDEYTDAMADLGALIHDRAYGPGFFSAGSLFFIRKGLADWGLERSHGRGLLNLAALVTRR